jgi:hypothetical protein
MMSPPVVAPALGGVDHPAAQAVPAVVGRLVPVAEHRDTFFEDAGDVFRPQTAAEILPAVDRPKQRAFFNVARLDPIGERADRAARPVTAEARADVARVPALSAVLRALAVANSYRSRRMTLLQHC